MHPLRRVDTRVPRLSHHTHTAAEPHSPPDARPITPTPDQEPGDSRPTSTSRPQASVPSIPLLDPTQSPSG